MSLIINNIKINNYKNRIKNINKDFFKNNLIIGKNGVGKSSLSNAIKGIIWHEIKKTENNTDILGDISGSATLNNNKVDFDTKRDNIWSVDNVASNPQSYYNLDLNNILHEDLTNYNDIKALVYSGNLKLSNLINTPGRPKKEIDPLLDSIFNINTQINNSVDSWNSIEDKNEEIQRNNIKIIELTHKIEIGQKLVNNSNLEDDINRLKDDIKEIIIPKYNGWNFLEKDYIKLDIKLNELSQQYEKIKESIFDLRNSEFKKEFKGNINELEADFNRLKELDSSIKKLETEKNTNESLLNNEKFNEIKLLDKDNLSDEFDIIEKIKNSYKSKALQEIKINNKDKYIGSAIGLLIIILSFVFKNYFILFGLLGLIPVFFIKTYDFGEIGETCDVKKLWQVSDYREYSELNRQLDECKRRLLEETKEKETINERIKNILIDNGLREDSDFITCKNFNETIIQNNKDNEKYEKEKGNLAKLIENFKKLMLDYSEIYNNEENIKDYYYEFQKNYKLFDNYNTLLEKKKEKETELKEKEELLKSKIFNVDLSEEEKNSYKDNLEQNREEQNQLNIRNGELRNEIEKIESLNIDNLEALRDKKIKDLKKEYDKFFYAFSYDFFSKKIKEMSQKFAVDITENTRKYFKKFTNEKYFLDAEENIIENKTNEIKQINELSSGVRSQLLLATKLAVIETQESDIKYPLFLDESFASCDDDSTKAIIEALSQIENRQIFYFSPKESSKEEWINALGEGNVNVIELS